MLSLESSLRFSSTRLETIRDFSTSSQPPYSSYCLAFMLSILRFLPFVFETSPRLVLDLSDGIAIADSMATGSIS